MVTPIRDILKSAARTWGIEPAADLAAARAAWPKIVGPALAERSTPLSLSRGRLRVGTSAAAAGQEIRLQSAAIARELNRELGSRRVTQVVVTMRRRLPATGPRGGRPGGR